MNMVQEVFRRYEKKYLLSPEQYEDSPIAIFKAGYAAFILTRPIIGWCGGRWKNLSIRKSCGCGTTEAPRKEIPCLWS